MTSKFDKWLYRPTMDFEASWQAIAPDGTVDVERTTERLNKLAAWREEHPLSLSVPTAAVEAVDPPEQHLAEQIGFGMGPLPVELDPVAEA